MINNVGDTFSDKNGLPLDLDMGGDLAELKKNLAKFKKGKHGKGLDDIDIEELDFVSNNCQSPVQEKISVTLQFF